MKSTQSCDWWGCDNYADQKWVYSVDNVTDTAFYCDMHARDHQCMFLRVIPGWKLEYWLEHPEGPWWSRAE